MDSLDYLLDRGKILDVLYALFLDTDNKNWERVEQYFSPRVKINMAAGTNGDHEEMTASEVVQSWKSNLEHVLHVHHQISNFRVKTEDDRATAHFNGIALHNIETPEGFITKNLVGVYEVGLQRVFDSWKVHTFLFRIKFIDERFRENHRHL
jgi:hypothetical protein